MANVKRLVEVKVFRWMKTKADWKMEKIRQTWVSPDPKGWRSLEGLFDPTGKQIEISPDAVFKYEIVKGLE